MNLYISKFFQISSYENIEGVLGQLFPTCIVENYIETIEIDLSITNDIDKNKLIFLNTYIPKLLKNPDTFPNFFKRELSETEFLNNHKLLLQLAENYRNTDFIYFLKQLKFQP